jgi:hypothetical protein
MEEEDMEKIWSGLMLRLCSRHRINARNGSPTDYEIERLRKDHYPAYEDAQNFKTIIYELARVHKEIQVDGDIIRVTRFGLDNCEKYDPTFQRDFKY